MSTRAAKVVAKQGDKVLDYIYVSSNGMNREGAYTSQATYSSVDEKLYHEVLAKVEQALWQPGMTNAEKVGRSVKLHQHHKPLSKRRHHLQGV